MEANENIVIEGIEVVIERDLNKHKVILERVKIELDGFEKARLHLIAKRKHYKGLIKGDNKYNKESLEKSRVMIGVDIRAMSDTIDITKKRQEHHTLIVDTLSEQLKNQYICLKNLAKYRKDQINGISN